MAVGTLGITSGPYTGNGVADQFSYTFKIEDKTQVSVYETDTNGVLTTLVVDTDYTVAGLGVDGGGIITRVAGALPIGYTWYIRSNYQATQPTSFTSQGAFYPVIHEDAMDKLTLLIQQLQDISDRSLHFGEYLDVSSISNILPLPAAGKHLAWNGSGDALINDPDDTPAQAIGANYTHENHVATAGQTVFTLTANTYNPGTRNLSVYINGVRQIPAESYTETSTTVVTFTEALAAGDKVQFVIGNATATISDIVYTTVNSISELVTSAKDRPVLVLNYHLGIQGGGGLFYWDPTQDKANHNGGTIIDPDVVFPTDWSNTTQQTTWFTAGTGMGCWIRVLDDATSVKDFGAQADGIIDDDLAISSAQTFTNSGGKDLLIPKGVYLRGVTTYTVGGDFTYSNDAFSTGVNVTGSAQNASKLITVETSTDPVIDSTLSRIGISVTNVARGAQHSSGVRANLNNYSTDGQGCTAFYGRAANTDTASWGAAVHGETRHGGGTSIGLSSENAGYSTLGSMYGLVINQTTLGAETTHPLTGAVKAVPATRYGTLITGKQLSGDDYAWKVGQYLNQESITSDGYGTRYDSIGAAHIWSNGNASYGAIFTGAYTTGSAIRIGTGLAVGWESTNTIKTIYDTGQWKIKNGTTDRVGFETSATPKMFLNGVSVVSERKIGWTAATGTATRTTFDTATVTTAQLAERVKALIDDLIAHGLIGA